MQSGISASQELLDAFQTLVSTSSQFGLLCTIEKERLVPLTVLSPSTSSFASDLSLLTPHIDPKTALYIILRRFDSAPEFICVTYVPDAAHVRQKMLFASSRLSLVRELGIERFRETIFATKEEELTKEGFERHDKHVKLAAPLTEEERGLEGVKRAEMEEGRGMGERRSMVRSGVTMEAGDGVREALEGLKIEGGKNLVQLKINIATEQLILDSTSTTPINALSTTISATEPRYSFFRYEHTHDNNTLSPILFIYTCPSGSKIKERMMYAASSRSAQQLAIDAGLEFAKKIEEGSPEDVTQESIDADLHPKVEVKKAFERPKRPGRK